MTWSHKKDDTYDAVIENNRTILYFGENFWVIDRPYMAGLNWLANSPINSWEKTKLKLYSSAQKDAVDLGAENNQNGFDIVQKVFRADFHFNDRGEVVLTNYPYSLSDENALTYVMTYALGETSLERDELNCKENIFHFPYQMITCRILNAIVGFTNKALLERMMLNWPFVYTGSDFWGFWFLLKT